ncbi:MAG: hypothetical protein CMI79_02930 [Candidatus Pelagibacter sp.]|nr:hypothetical protein [Candidatus Pelagibacter sp.]|tara:strand:+ start:5006 stop:5263 length:258 start_codon:yes stop_codon:yes gene_type:complete
MFNKIKTVIYFSLLVIFFISISLYYFSDSNKNRIIKNRKNLSSNMDIILKNLPILKNDTNNIMSYETTETENKKIKKRYFWDLLK